ncbi:hypothetical protein GCM10011391_04650 [Pullulanibacillus camelliae]|uniref:Uncharacterized protein n=1 Tax=Pullulanibacillus camelliae TaxID=1707096 RepID=A0A8J2VKX3_9BACL|nr:hypothetical protein GCM10011391_04650 [Pullulanibacillus camelliae]
MVKKALLPKTKGKELFCCEKRIVHGSINISSKKLCDDKTLCFMLSLESV